MNLSESKFQYDDDDDDDEPEHSALGIASFVIACASGLIEFGCVAYAGIAETIKPGAMDNESIETAIVGLGFIGGALVCLVGMLLGVAGLFQRDQKKTFPVLGLVIGALVLACVGGLFIMASITE